MFLVVVLLSLLQAQQAPRTGVLQGVVTTQGSVHLPGAQVTVTDKTDKQIAQILTGEDGHFNVIGVAPGRYKLTAVLASFVANSTTVDVAVGRVSDVAIDLQIEGISASVEVVAQS